MNDINKNASNSKRLTEKIICSQMEKWKNKSTKFIII
jgi:hypothetical protein